jgi:hypothetical protein
MVDGSLRNANVLTLSLQLFEDIPDVSTPFVVKIRVMNYDVDPRSEAIVEWSNTVCS